MGQVRPRAAVLATVGALGIAASAYFSWSGGGAAETARTFPLRKLLFVSNVTGDAPSYWQSMAAPLVVVGAIGVLGALLLSRVVLLISTLLGLATIGLWVATFLLDKNGGGFSINNVGVGSWVALGGLLVMLVGLIALRERGEEEEEDEAVQPFSPLPRTYGSSERTTRIGPGTATGSPGSSASPGLGTAGGSGSAGVSPSSPGPLGGSGSGRYLPGAAPDLGLGSSSYGDSGSGSSGSGSGGSDSGGSGSSSGGSFSSF